MLNFILLRFHFDLVFKHELLTKIRSKSLRQRYINTTIVFLDIIYQAVLYLKPNVSKTEFCLSSGKKSTLLGPIHKASPSLQTLAQT
jgi:hypothetical protein